MTFPRSPKWTLKNVETLTITAANRRAAAGTAASNFLLLKKLATEMAESKKSEDKSAAEVERKCTLPLLDGFVAPDVPSDNTLLERYWEDRNGKSLNFCKLLVLLGADPSELAAPKQQVEKFPLDRREQDSEDMTKLGKFRDIAQKAWKTEHDDSETLIKDKAQRNLNDSHKNIVALSLDGGGIRGMISALTLRFVSNRVFGDEHIADRVHWISGTSTGAIIALALIKEPRSTPTDCLNLYWALKSEVFSLMNKSRFREVVGKTANEQTTKLTKMLQSEFQRNALNNREFHWTIDNENRQHVPKTCITTLNITKKPAKFVVLRNYKNPNKSESVVSDREFWEAARMSSAAPTYFVPYIDGQKQAFVDGGLSANAPVDVLLREIENDSAVEVGAFLSIGTGSNIPKNREVDWLKIGLLDRPKQLKNLIYLLEDQALGKDGRAMRCVETSIVRRGRGLKFVRLSPAEIDVGLKCVDNVKLIRMLWTTLIYLTSEEALKSIEEFANNFKFSQWNE